MSTNLIVRDGAVHARAPAKVNLRLRILAREVSGYHQLETIYCALELADELVVERGGGTLRLEVEGAELGPPDQNLAHRAARAFFQATGQPADARITLRKRIAAGAGLGGGSSDAAATLEALNALYDDPLDRRTLLRLGGELGSDVPFFLCGSPLALAWGRGERLLPLPALPPKPALIVVPGFAIATPEAYHDLAAHRELAGTGARPIPEVLGPDVLTEWKTLADHAANDFEPPTYNRHPQLAQIREVLAQDATIALLSGSGSALFALYPDPKTRDQAAHRTQHAFPNTQVHHTTTAAHPQPQVPDP